MIYSVKDWDLEAKTQAYWAISMSFNNRIATDIPFDQALDTIEDIFSKTNPARPLISSLEILQEELIEGEGFPYPQPAKVYVLPLI
jgi:hypothetical protein